MFLLGPRLRKVVARRLQEAFNYRPSWTRDLGSILEEEEREETDGTKDKAGVVCVCFSPFGLRCECHATGWQESLETLHA